MKYVKIVLVCIAVLGVPYILLSNAQNIDRVKNEGLQFDLDHNGKLEGEETIAALRTWNVPGEKMIELLQPRNKTKFLESLTDQQSKEIIGQETLRWLSKPPQLYDQVEILKFQDTLIKKVVDTNRDEIITAEEAAAAWRTASEDPYNLRNNVLNK